MVKNRLDWGVVNSLSEYAKRLLKTNEIPSELSRRDVEILASAKVCERCGAVYSGHDYFTGDCPVCVGEIANLERQVEEVIGDYDDAEFELRDANELISYLKEENTQLKEKLKQSTKD